MKHRFLLDVMVIRHAVEGVNESHEADTTAAELVRLIGENCHRVVADKVLAEKYSRHLNELFTKPPLLFQTVSFLTEIIYNSSKFVVDPSNPPPLPEGIRVPREDEYVVRAALISRPIVVTAERKLLKAINSQETVLRLEALHPKDALNCARET